MYKIFQDLVSAGKVEYSSLRNARVKVHVPCQWTCSFCHMEGNHHSSSIQEESHLRSVLSVFHDIFDFNEVHFTGGEPTIHGKIVNFIALAKRMGFIVKMTTNGQAPVQRYLDCIEAGLDELNVSIHTLSARELAAMMAPPRSEKWAENALNRQKTLISSLRSILKVKINTVVGVSETPALAIADYVQAHKLEWRVMVELGNDAPSFRSIKGLIHALGAEPKQAHFIRGSSSCSLSMITPAGFEFKVKLIRPFVLESMCRGCPIRAEGNCQEYAYGPRVEAQGGELLVRSCIHRDGSPFTLAVQEFVFSETAAELKRTL